MRLDKLIEARLQTTRKAQKRLFLTGQVKVDGKIEHQENRNIKSKSPGVSFLPMNVIF